MKTKTLITQLQRIAAALEQIVPTLTIPDVPADRTENTPDSIRAVRHRERDYGFTVPARVRDGDNCRWCGVLIHWRGPQDDRTAEFIHISRNQVLWLAVACRACAGTAGQTVSKSSPPLPAPESPHYGQVTKRFLDTAGVAGLTKLRSGPGPNVDLLPLSRLSGQPFKFLPVLEPRFRIREFEADGDSSAEQQNCCLFVGLNPEIKSVNRTKPVGDHKTQHGQCSIIDRERLASITKNSHDSSLPLGKPTDHSVGGCGDLSLGGEPPKTSAPGPPTKDLLKLFGVNYCFKCGVPATGEARPITQTAETSWTREDPRFGTYSICDTCYKPNDAAGNFVEAKFCTHCGFYDRHTARIPEYNLFLCKEHHEAGVHLP